MINYDNTTLYIFTIKNKELSGFVSTLKISNLNDDEYIEKIYFIHAEVSKILCLIFMVYIMLIIFVVY